MKQIILRQKKIGIIPRGPYDVYVNNVFVGSISRYSSLSIPVENDIFVLTLKHRSFFSSSKECQISKDNTIVEYEPVDARLLIATGVWDIITVFAMLFHLKLVPNYIWLCGIFGLPFLAILRGLIRRKRYFKIEIVDQ
ncbi:MAG: hypothetical protein IKZ52_09480 [Bacteroidales bacterium]|nr:hypothetical protein [Bacteroidales bacterium]